MEMLERPVKRLYFKYLSAATAVLTLRLTHMLDAEHANAPSMQQ